MAAPLSPRAQEILDAIEQEAAERRRVLDDTAPAAYVPPADAELHAERFVRLVDSVSEQTTAARARLDGMNAAMDEAAERIGVELPPPPRRAPSAPLSARRLRAAFGRQTEADDDQATGSVRAAGDDGRTPSQGEQTADRSAVGPDPVEELGLVSGQRTDAAGSPDAERDARAEQGAPAAGSTDAGREARAEQGAPAAGSPDAGREARAEQGAPAAGSPDAGWDAQGALAEPSSAVGDQPRAEGLLAGLPAGLAAAAIAPPRRDAPLALPPRTDGRGTGVPPRDRRPAPVPDELRDRD